jgi:xanthosine utilization system XapX-like protein
VLAIQRIMAAAEFPPGLAHAITRPMIALVTVLGLAIGYQSVRIGSGVTVRASSTLERPERVPGLVIGKLACHPDGTRR